MPKHRRWQAAFCGFRVNKLKDLLFPAQIYIKVFWAEYTQCCRMWDTQQSSRMISLCSLSWFSIVSFKPKFTPMLCLATMIAAGFPSCQGGTQVFALRACKVPGILRGKSKSTSNKLSYGFLGFSNPTSSLFQKERYRTILQAPEQTHPDKGHLSRPALHRGQSTFQVFSVAENWAPLTVSCSHNQSNPFSPSNFHLKKKSYIWTQNRKNIFTSLYKYTHPIFNGTLCQRKEGHGSEISLHIKCCNYEWRLMETSL